MINNKEYEIIMTFPVLHVGWELDYVAYLVNDNDTAKLVMSGHGKFYFAEESHLKEKIKEYEEALDLSHLALKTIKQYS